MLNSYYIDTKYNIFYIDLHRLSLRKNTMVIVMTVMAVVMIVRVLTYKLEA